MIDITTLPMGEEAAIDRQLEERGAKIVGGQATEKDRQEFQALVIRRSNLVQQMGLSRAGQFGRYARR